MATLPPPPTSDVTGSFGWLEWFRQLRTYITQVGSVPWNIINFAGSKISDIADTDHQKLDSLQGGVAGQYYHLTQAKYNTVANLDLTGVSGTGVKVDTTTPTFGWRDLEGLIQPKTSGAGSPTWTTFRGNIKEWKFVANDIVDLKYHMPHDWVPGTDIYIHLHWCHNGTAISGSIVFDYRWTYQKGHNQGTYPSDVTFTQTISTPNVATYPRYAPIISEVQFSKAVPSANEIDTDILEADGLIKISGKASTVPTVTGGDFFIEYIDIHYQSSNIGTKNKAPAFFV